MLNAVFDYFQAEGIVAYRKGLSIQMAKLFPFDMYYELTVLLTS
jgi:hypothetical protein